MELKDFISIFYSPGAPVLINNTIEIEDYIVFTPYNFNNRYASLENIKFTNHVLFQNVDLCCGIKFKNCTFEKELSFFQSEADAFDKAFNIEFFNIFIENCEINTLKIYRGKFERGIRVTHNSKIEKLEIQNVEITKGSFYLLDSTVSEKFDFDHSIIKNDITVQKSVVKSRVRFTNTHINSLVFTNSTLENDFQVWSGIVSSIIFNDNTFNDDVTITAVEFSGTFTVNGDEFKKALKIAYEDSTNHKVGGPKEIYISKGKFGNGLDLSAKNQIINKIQIGSSKILTGTLQFKDCIISEAILTGDNHQGNIVFDKSQFEKLHFKNFTNYGNLILSSVQALGKNSSEFLLEGSNLGKAQFFNVSLHSFTKVLIRDSYLSDITTSGIAWFNDNALVVAGPEDPESNFESFRRRREIYRQLKQSQEKQGDKIQSLEFRALEMSAYKNQLTSQNKGINQNKIILWAIQSNDFGLNWWKPLWIIVLITAFFYLILVPIVSPKFTLVWASSLDETYSTLQEWNDYLFIFPQLFNPARSFKQLFTVEHPFVEKGFLYFMAFFLDAVHRIVLAFFIVQIVSAFRKYIN